MARKKKVEEAKAAGGESGSGRWMLTYLDMVTLLFGVFVIMYAMSQNNPAKMKIVAESIRMAFQGGNTIDTATLTGGSTIIDELTPEGVIASRVFRKTSQLFRLEIQKKSIQVTQDERGVVISLIGDDFFPPGSAELSEETERVIGLAGSMLRELEYYIRIEGHTDQSGEHSQSDEKYYDSDWELSSQRSINVLRFLQNNEKVDPYKMSAVGYGSYKPFDTSGTPESNAVNRRVEIVIVTGKKYKPRKQEEKAKLPYNYE